MPSPVLIAALVVNEKIRPAPPVQRMTAFAVLDQQRGCEPLVVAHDPLVLERSLEERMEHVEAGLVGGVQRPVHGHAAEGADADATVGIPAPRAAPVLQL